MFASQELPIRAEFGYPPITCMIRIIIRGPLETTTEQFAESIVEVLQPEASRLGDEGRILGPVAAPIPKLRGNFRFHILLYSRDNAALRDVVRTTVNRLKAPEGVVWVIDVDPLDML